MVLCYFSINKEIKKIILFGIVYRLCLTFVTVLTNFLGKKQINENVINFLQNSGGFGLLFLYIFETILSKRISEKKKDEAHQKIFKKNIKIKFIDKYRKTFLLLCCFFLKFFIVNFQYYPLKYYLSQYNKDKWVTEELEQIAVIIIGFILFYSKKNFYIHHSLSFFLIAFSIVIKIIVNKSFLIYVIFCFFRNYFNCLCLYIYKMLNEFEYSNIYWLGFLDGVFYFVNFILYESIKYFITSDTKFFQSFKFTDWNFLMIIILNFSIGFFYNYVTFYIIHILDPTYITFPFVLINFILAIPNLLDKQFLTFFLQLLILICCLLYLEILIINICGLGENVKINIQNRAQIEYTIESQLDLSQQDFNSILPQ